MTKQKIKNRPVPAKEMKVVIKNIPTMKIIVPESLTNKFYKIVKEDIILIPKILSENTSSG